MKAAFFYLLLYLLFLIDLHVVQAYICVQMRNNLFKSIFQVKIRLTLMQIFCKLYRLLIVSNGFLKNSCKTFNFENKSSYFLSICILCEYGYNILSYGCWKSQSMADFTRQKSKLFSHFFAIILKTVEIDASISMCTKYDL